MSCKHAFIQEEWIVEVCKKCDKLRAQTVFEDDLAAANARIAGMRKNNEATVKLVVAEIDALNERAESAETALADEKAKREQAEAQCAAMRNCDNCNKWCMKQPNNSEFDTLNRMDDCKFNNLSHWELSKKIAKAALEVKP